MTSHGKDRLPYDGLVIATGAEPALPPIAGLTDMTGLGATRGVRVLVDAVYPVIPAGSCGSYPRCSVISASNAVSSTCLVNPVNTPSGPTSSTPSVPGGLHELLR